MDDQMAIFHFIKEQGGAANLDQLKQRFNQVPNLKAVLEENSLFWISKITENNWEIRAKLDVELCSSYLQGICNGSCTSLHICKSFLLSGKFCKEPCKSGFSHNVRDSHNKTVLDVYNMDGYVMKLLRSSFPRLCASFQENGKCGKLFCGYLHLCVLYVQGKCQNQCQLAVSFGLSKQETHGLTSPHNVKVLSSFDLLQKKRDVLLGNILYHSGFEVDNEIEMNSERSQIVSKDSDQGKSRLQKSNIRMCLAYLNGACREGSACHRLHFCKEVLIDSSKCPGNTCIYGFSHDPFDKSNCKIIKSKWKNIEDKTKIVTAMSESFPRVCRPNETKSCGNKDCKKLHICRYFLFDVCANKRCTLSHKLTDEHNMKVFKHYNMTNLITQKKDIIVSNVLVSKVHKQNKLEEKHTAGNSKQAMKILEESNSFNLARCSFKDEESRVSGSTATQQSLILCSYYLEGKCDKGNGCKRLHLCKEFLINYNKCPGISCKFGFSHDPFDDNNAKIIKSKWTHTDHKQIISFLRESFPRLCKKYEKGDCEDGNCKKLHICEDFLFNTCENNDCYLSHNITDEHNNNIFKRYNLADLSKKPMTYILPNILISKRVGSASGSAISTYTNLRKPSQFSSRKSLSQSTTSISATEGDTNFAHFASNESIFSDRSVTEVFSNEECNLRAIDDKGIRCAHFPDQYNLKGSVNSDKMIAKHRLKRGSSRDISADIKLPGSFIGSSEISLSETLLDSEHTKSNKASNLGFSATSSCDLSAISRTKEGAQKTILKPSVEDVSSYILSNFEEGYCMINDVGFQLLFAEKSEEKILKWCKMQQRYFRLNVSENNTIRIYPCSVDVEPCSLYWRRSGCKKGKCGKFHICKRLMLGEIHNHNSCTQNHSFENETLKQLIKCNKLESFTEKQILVLLRNRFPFVCPRYQTSSCVEGEKKCSMLHICQHFVTKKCAKTDDICELNHEAALTSKQAERISEEFHIPQSRLSIVLLIKGTIQKIGATSFKDGQLDWQKETVLCIDFLNGSCSLKKRCTLKHNPHKTPYLWQYKGSNETSWTNYDKKSNENIERSFCNPSQTRSGHTNDPTLEVWFQQVPKIHETHFTNGFSMLYRRLSTCSSVADDNCTKLGTTKWKWYWQKSEDVWEEYKTGATSKDIEKSFLMPNQTDHVFRTNEFLYVLSFTEMRQRNMDDRYCTERSVRRRPEFQPANDLKMKGHATKLYPSHWPNSIAEGSAIDVSNKVLEHLKENFQESIKKSVRIISIKEICNHDYYDRYESKKKKMDNKYSANEKLLYHGTSFDVADAICHQNFDSRLCGKNATLYGKGAYFSKSASYSHNYSTADSKGHYYMFVAQVLVGRFTTGDPSYVRPPPLKPGDYELYDSCVDKESNPTMFIVFERDQCYPKYLIEYELNKSAKHSPSYSFSSPNFSTTSSPSWSSASPNTSRSSNRSSTSSRSTSQSSGTGDDINCVIQ